MVKKYKHHNKLHESGTSYTHMHNKSSESFCVLQKRTPAFILHLVISAGRIGNIDPLMSYYHLQQLTEFQTAD